MVFGMHWIALVLPALKGPRVLPVLPEHLDRKVLKV
jgi:hypothetical protein